MRHAAARAAFALVPLLTAAGAASAALQAFDTDMSTTAQTESRCAAPRVAAWLSAVFWAFACAQGHTQTVQWEGRPAFEAMACPQRQEQMLQFWGNLPRQPNACASARKTLAVAKDLVATKKACGESAFWTTTEDDASIAAYAQTAQRVCGAGASSLRKTGAGAPGGAAGCPSDVTVQGRTVSVLEPIQANGSAAAALNVARGTLRQITGQGSCSGFDNSRECEINLQVWRDVVRALDCHAQAERSAPPPPAGVDKPAPESGDKAAATGAGDKAAAGGSGAADFLPFGDKGSGAAAKVTGASSGKSNGAAGFLSFGGSVGSGNAGAAFPTPFCQFISDARERHDPEAQVCVAGIAYMCLGRSSPRGSDAWHVTGTSGCGTVRSIQAVEDGRREDRQRTKIYED